MCKSVYIMEEMKVYLYLLCCVISLAKWLSFIKSVTYNYNKLKVTPADIHSNFDTKLLRIGSSRYLGYLECIFTITVLNLLVNHCSRAKHFRSIEMKWLLIVTSSNLHNRKNHIKFPTHIHSHIRNWIDSWLNLVCRSLYFSAIKKKTQNYVRMPILTWFPSSILSASKKKKKKYEIRNK